MELHPYSRVCRRHRTGWEGVAHPRVRHGRSGRRAADAPRHHPRVGIGGQTVHRRRRDAVGERREAQARRRRAHRVARAAGVWAHDHVPQLAHAHERPARMEQPGRVARVAPRHARAHAERRVRADHASAGAQLPGGRLLLLHELGLPAAAHRHRTREWHALRAVHYTADLRTARHDEHTVA